MTRAEAEGLLFKEARLLDERRFREWLDMFAEDCMYWVPTLDGVSEDPGLERSIIYDDRARLEERVFRLTETRAFAQLPPSRTQHNISNVEVTDSSPGEAEVRCNLLLVELREGDASQTGLGSQRLLAARCRYILVGGPDWRIRMRKLSLINRDLAHYNLSFIL